MLARIAWYCSASSGQVASVWYDRTATPGRNAFCPCCCFVAPASSSAICRHRLSTALSSCSLVWFWFWFWFCTGTTVRLIVYTAVYCTESSYSISGRAFQAVPPPRDTAGVLKAGEGQALREAEK